MDIKFTDIIHLTRSSCKKCVSIIYEVPCPIDAKLPEHLTNFGEPVYDINKGNYLKIATNDGHTVEAKLGRGYIKFGMPKHLENTDLNITTRKLEFEKSIISWIEDLLKINIIRG